MRIYIVPVKIQSSVETNTSHSFEDLRRLTKFLSASNQIVKDLDCPLLPPEGRKNDQPASKLARFSPLSLKKPKRSAMGHYSSICRTTKISFLKKNLQEVVTTAGQSWDRNPRLPLQFVTALLATFRRQHCTAFQRRHY